MIRDKISHSVGFLHPRQRHFPLHHGLRMERNRGLTTYLDERTSLIMVLEMLG